MTSDDPPIAPFKRYVDPSDGQKCA